jgi:hypothetical protein
MEANEMNGCGEDIGIRLNEDYSESAEKLGKAGWILPMDLPPFTPIDICKDITKADEIMFEYYTNDIRFSNMVAELIASKTAEKHRLVLLQAYCAYKLNLYTLCISSLNPLFEGFLSNLSSNKNNISIPKIIEDIKTNHYDSKNTSVPNQIDGLFYTSLKAFFSEYTKSTDFSKEQKEYTRNNLAHGRIYINDDQLEVIKLFSNLYNIAIFFSDDVNSTTTG